MKRRIVELDGLRGVAVGLVVLSHTQSMMPGQVYSGLLAPLDVIASGRLGVLIFFVLSGYLITNILIDERARTGAISIRHFYYRRVLRIFPASYCYILIIALLALAGIAHVSALQVGLAAFQIQNYAAALFGPDGTGPFEGKRVLGHFWTLALEEQFYWIWPFVLVKFRKQAPVILIVIVALLPLVRIASYLLWPTTRLSLTSMFHTAIDPIAIGALLALWQDRAWALLQRIPDHAITLVIGVLFLVTPLVALRLEGAWTFTCGPAIEASIAAAMVAMLIRRPDFWLSRVMRWRPLQFLGAISFSLYLWQEVFCLRGATFAMPPLAAIPVSILVATLSCYLIERPFQRLYRSASRRAAAQGEVGLPDRG